MRFVKRRVIITLLIESGVRQVISPKAGTISIVIKVAQERESPVNKGRSTVRDWVRRWAVMVGFTLTPTLLPQGKGNFCGGPVAYCVSAPHDFQAKLPLRLDNRQVLDKQHVLLNVQSVYKVGG